MATPAVVSDGEGDAEFTVKRNRIKFKLRWEDLTSRVIFAHIHCGVAGENRPVGVTLLHETKRADGRISGTFSGPDAENRCGWETLADVLEALASGGALCERPHREFPQRGDQGQVKPDDLRFEAELDPDQEVGEVVSDGEGEAQFTVRRNRVRFRLEWEDLTSKVIFAHIHCGVPGENRPVGVTLLHETKRPDGRVRGSFSGPDAENDCGWDSLGDVLGAMASGKAYVNVHTQNFPGGEIRGQIEID